MLYDFVINYRRFIRATAIRVRTVGTVDNH